MTWMVKILKAMKRSGGAASTKELATELRLSRSHVLDCMARLKRQGYVRKGTYHVLTERK